jgi:hypothetical protein
MIMAKGSAVKTTRAVKGVIAPSKDDALKVVARVRRDLKADPRLGKRFLKNPRGLLGAYGLNEDVQRELLRDAGVKDSVAICWFTDCFHTCYFTDCVFTHLVMGTGKLAPLAHKK